MPVLSNARWERFAQGIAAGMTAGDAYARAGFDPDPRNATKLKNRPGVRERIAEILEYSAEAAGVTAERVIAELSHIAFNDPTKAVRWASYALDEASSSDAKPGRKKTKRPGRVFVGMTFTDAAKLPKSVRAAISSVKQTKEGLEIRFHDKGAALEKLGRYVGIFKEENATVNVQVTLSDLIAQSYEPKDG